MHEYDVIERKEEQDSLPTNTKDSNYNSNNTNKRIDQKTQDPKDQDQDSVKEESSKASSSSSISPSPKALYPFVVEYIDQVVQTIVFDPVASSVEAADTPPKPKRKRRVYITDSGRSYNLRPRGQEVAGTAVPTEASGTQAAKEKDQSPPLAPQTQIASPTPTEATEFLHPDHFKPEFWNIIEEEQDNPKALGKKKRGIRGIRKRRNQLVTEIYSPETEAAIAAAQLELDATAKSNSRVGRKRTCTMSLYDRRYQTAGDERRVANGYGGNGLRAGPSASTNEIESQDMQGHQYYGSSGSSTAPGLNGSAAINNHAPAMGTLCNIGNTCYLNSVVYTLRFAPHFLHNLHHLIHDLNVVQQTIMRQHTAKSASLGRHVSGGGGVAQLEHARSWSSKDLVTTEPPYGISNSNGNVSVNSNSTSCTSASSNTSKSSHQSVSEKLHELYHNLHGNEMTDSTEPYHADTLLHAIQDVNATFEGNQQQDAHEFLMCVLNCIRETNQSLIKAIGECPEVMAHGYISNPDEVDSSDGGLERMESSVSISGNGMASQASAPAVPTPAAVATATTKTSFFSRKSKRKDDLKSSASSKSSSTRVQSPLKEQSPTASSATSNSLFYLNTVDLTGAPPPTSSSSSSTSPPLPLPPPTASAPPTKYTSDDEMNSSSLLKKKMRLEERIRELNLNFFSADFEGIVVLTTKCLSCETVTRQKQGMLDISVPVPISGYDNAELQEKPSAYIQNSCITKEYFRGENKYSCNQCTGYTEAIRSISYEVLPRLLVIQLNRFSGGMEKVSTYVPTTFTLPCFCVKCCELTEGNKLHVYKLYSVITHVGATLTVGHYIAYTCFLDLASDYMNCPKDRRNNMTQQHTTSALAATTGMGSNENAAPNNGQSSSITPVSAAASVLASSGTSLMKKMKFGRSKASSSGDMSKNVKQLNGISSKTITNGIGKLTMNTTCHGVNCCAMRLCCSQQTSAAGSCSDFSEECLQNGSNSNLSYSSSQATNVGGVGTTYPPGYGSTGRGGVKANYPHGSTEPIWYMCDDDKIKAMTQREFEELLSPTRKITITPYLLFYARFDLQATSSSTSTQATPSKPGASAASTPPSSQSSWSTDNGAHKI
ncbi:ubiquitin carboxyl-terminal hydrolase 1 [Drosophila tropicalis]|uniref:ubiquitin carboxyl-terminal hydrolase 1 n=1 Tax=Drosophila tropicalis TaxID=46794 RepID=UPI0035ABD59A